VDSTGSCGTTIARCLALGASAPWKRIRCCRGCARAQGVLLPLARVGLKVELGRERFLCLLEQLLARLRIPTGRAMLERIREPFAPAAGKKPRLGAARKKTTGHEPEAAPRQRQRADGCARGGVIMG